MSSRLLPSLALIVAVAIATPAMGVEGDAHGQETVELQLNHLGTTEALVAVRSLVGLRQIEELPDNGIRLSGAGSDIDLAARILVMIDTDGKSVEKVDSHAIPQQDSTVARFLLENARASEVMDALRRVLAIRNLSAFSSPPMVVIRDSSQQFRSARELVEILDKPCNREQ